jgi:deoxyribodipyrimidine photo-lyase
MYFTVILRPNSEIPDKLQSIRLGVIMKRGLVWLRRDLRIHDHAALSAALQSCEQVFLAFIFDQTILDPLKDHQRTHPQNSDQSSSTSKMITDRRVHFIWLALQEINH